MLRNSIVFLAISLAVLSLSFQEKPKEVVVIGVGDIMLGTNYPSNSYLPPNQAADVIDADMKKILSSAQVTFGNLEGTFLDEGGDVKKCSDPDKCYAFRMPTSYAVHLKEAGFDVMSIANNHVGDFGNTGRTSTKATLDAQGILAAGLLQYPKVVFEREGLIYGFAAFAPNSGTCDIRDIAAAQQIVRELADTADIVIVSFHGGAEGSKYEHITKATETFYGENRGNVHEFAHKMIDAGADIIFGHGPHVTRAVEVYNDRFIAYSLGNFATYGRFNLLGVNGIAPLVKVHVAPDGKFLLAEVVSIKQSGEGGAKVDESATVFKKLAELTNSDFPGHNLLFENNRISLK
ncbi:CapA family protein [bacterium]|nr:CapA family protein [bacterium]